MVRLMLVLAPVMCILSGIAVSHILSIFMRNLDIFDTKARKKKSDNYPVKNEVAGFVILMMTFFLVAYTFHCTWVSECDVSESEFIHCFCMISKMCLRSINNYIIVHIRALLCGATLKG